MFTFYDTNLVNSNTLTVYYGADTSKYLHDGMTTTKHYATGAANTATVIALITLPSDTSASLNVMVMNHNLQRFYVLAVGYPAITSTVCSVQTYNGANTLIEMPFANGVRYVQIGIYSNTSSTTPYIGELIVTKEPLVEFNGPSHNNFAESSRTIGIQREMSDGGVINIRTSQKYSAEMTLNMVSSTTYNSLLDVWDSNKSFVFVPFPSPIVVLTGTTSYSAVAWDGGANFVQWAGDFTYQYTNNNPMAGYTIPISLREVPN
jgi:hypothetical protein